MALSYQNNKIYRNSYTYRGMNASWTKQTPTATTWEKQTPASTTWTKQTPTATTWEKQT